MTITSVRWPICMVNIGPYFSRKSRTTYMKGRFWRMTWTRFPTSGHPGGPGGKFFDLPPVADQYRHHRVRKRAAKKSIAKSINSIVERV